MPNDTSIIYNGIALNNVLTDDINQEVVMDSTGVNPIYVRVSVSVTCLVQLGATSNQDNQNGIALKAYGGESTTLADGFNQVIDNLMQPGRDFEMNVGGSSLFSVFPGWKRPGLSTPPQSPIRRMDINHGPIPSVQVIQVVSAKTFRIRFRVVCHLPYVDTNGQVPGGAVSFRFWISEDIDCKDWTTERVYSGVFRVRHLGHNVMTEFRNNFRLPPLLKGFQRKHISLHQRPNGLELDFTIRDKEVWAVAPWPASDWEGHQTLFTQGAMGSLLCSDVYVRLWADKTVSKEKLWQMCQRIMDAKLHRLDMTEHKQTFLVALRYKDDFKNNSIEANATIKLIGKNDAVLWDVPKGTFAKDMSAGAWGLGKQGGDDPYDKEIAYQSQSTACIQGLFLATLQDPLHVTGWPDTVVESSTALYSVPKDCDTPVVPDDSPSQISTLWSDEHKLQGAYNVYRVTSDNQVNHGTIQLPFGKTSETDSNTSKVLKVFKSTGKRVVVIEAERVDAWPSLPPNEMFVDPNSGIGHTPLSSSINPSAPVLSWDGKKTLYHIDAKYVFSMSRNPVAVDGEIMAGLLPYRVKGNDDVYTVPVNAFQNSSLFAPSGTATFTGTP